MHHNEISGQVNNFGGTGMGIYIDAWHYPTYNIDVYNNLVYNSEEGVEINCEDCAKGGYVRDIRVFNNIFYNNIDPLSSGWKGRGMSLYACCNAGPHLVDSIHVYNNTMVGSKITGISIENPDASNIFIRNNIIVNNGTNNDINISQCASAMVENNIVSAAVRNNAGSAATVSNNRVENPLFINAAGRDYHLQSASPAVNAAIGGDVASFDYDGTPRPQGNTADIGAYEFSSASVMMRKCFRNAGKPSLEIRYESLGRTMHLPAQFLDGYSIKLVDISGKVIAASSNQQLKIPANTCRGLIFVQANKNQNQR